MRNYVCGLMYCIDNLLELVPTGLLLNYCFVSQVTFQIFIISLNQKNDVVATPYIMYYSLKYKEKSFIIGGPSLPSK